MVSTIVIILTLGLLISGCLEPEESNGSDGDDYEYIHVWFKDNVTVVRANEIVQSFNCTATYWENVSGGGWRGGVRVPQEEAQEYIRLFENHWAVKRAK